MPKPLQQKSDEKPIHEQVREMMRKAYTERMAPIGVVFSHDGYSKAMSQTVPGMDPWSDWVRDPNLMTQKPMRYLGFLFTVVEANAPQLNGGPVSLVLVSGGSKEASRFRTEQRAAITASVGGPEGKPIIDIIASKLTAAQLSDIISAWADANNHTIFAQILREAVGLHGSFE